MAISVNWFTKVITVPKADLTLIVGSLYEMDTDQFRKDLKSLEDDAEGMPFQDTHRHSTEVTVAGTTYARAIEIINGYSITFEDGQYAVRLVGSNNNFFDVENGILNRNQVSVIPTNSAGLIRTDIPGKPTDAHLAVAYDGTDINIGVWLDRLGETVLSPTSATVSWHNADGTLLFTENDSDPDSNGHFEMTKTQALSDDEAYYADVTVVDAEGTITTRRGISTVATV